MPLTPNNREEHWLQGMVDGSTTLEPNKRREYWYKEIVDAIGSGGGGGTGGGVLVIHRDESGVLDKTWQEIADAIAGGMLCVVPYANILDEQIMDAGFYFLTGVAYVEGEGYTVISDFKDDYNFIATDRNGYPVFD